MPISPLLYADRHQEDSGTAIVLAGVMDLDSSCVFTRAFAAALSTEALAMHVDLSAVAFCDCGGLSALLKAAQDARAGGRTFQAHAPAPAVLRMLTLTDTADTLLGRDPFASGQLGHDEAV
ncbi:STAS domain-containing protein [Streptomyces sp. NPDC058221]|uniref:STAS domain-containing protein n=1 Tax=Streptomyces sp. NPDC058221 TaxID=3346388 RepID=UPI0036E37A03